VNNYLSHTPVVREMLESHVATAHAEQREVMLSMLEGSPWRWRLAQLTVPVLCLFVYLVWTGTGIREEAIRDLIVPVTAGDWLLILPYALLVPVLLGRDTVQSWLLRRRKRLRLAERDPEASVQKASSPS
jgi:hypothetical protein